IFPATKCAQRVKDAPTALKGLVAFFAGPNSYRPLDRGDEYLPVANPARGRSLSDDFDNTLHALFRDCDLELELWQEIDHVLGPSVKLCMPLLPAEPLDLADRHAGDAGVAQGVAYIVEFEWLDDGGDHLHGNWFRAFNLRLSNQFRAI